MLLNGRPVKASGPGQPSLSSGGALRALQPRSPFLIICRWQTSGHLEVAAGGPSALLTGRPLDPPSHSGSVHRSADPSCAVIGMLGNQSRVKGQEVSRETDPTRGCRALRDGVILLHPCVDYCPLRPGLVHISMVLVVLSSPNLVNVSWLLRLMNKTSAVYEGFHRLQGSVTARALNESVGAVGTSRAQLPPPCLPS